MTRSLSRGVLVAGLTAVALAALGGGAAAFFAGNGAGASTAAVSSLGTTTISTPTVGGGTVSLSWSAVSAPGSGTVQYYVTRDGGQPGVACPNEGAPAAVTTCTDSDVPIGEHTYRVIAIYKSWTTTSAVKTAKVLTGPATKFTIAGNNAAPAAGASVNLTITAKDASNNTVTSYTGSKSLIFSGAEASGGGNKPTVVNSSGTAINFGSSTSITFSSGVASVSSSKNGVMKLYKSGVSEIDVDEGSISAPVPLAVTVSPGTFSKFVLGGATATPAVGAEDDLTITAQDTYGNTATAYDGEKSVVFTTGSTSSTSPGGNVATVADLSGNDIAFGTATPMDFDAGVATGSNGKNGTMKLYKSATQLELKANVSSLTSAGFKVTASAGSATKLVLTASATSFAATSSTNLTLTAQDVYANTATSYAGSKNVTFSGASASPTGTNPTVVNAAGTTVAFGSATALTFTNGVAATASSKNGLARLPNAAPASVTATDGTLSTANPLAFTVSAGTASRVAFDGLASSAGSVSTVCRLTCTVSGLGNSGTITGGLAITDTLGNAVSNLGTKTITVSVTTGGTITGSPLTIPEKGEAATATDFQYKPPSSGSYTHTITAASSGYTSATATVTK